MDLTLKLLLAIAPFIIMVVAVGLMTNQLSGPGAIVALITLVTIGTAIMTWKGADSKDISKDIKNILFGLHDVLGNLYLIFQDSTEFATEVQNISGGKKVIFMIYAYFKYLAKLCYYLLISLMVNSYRSTQLWRRVKNSFGMFWRIPTILHIILIMAVFLPIIFAAFVGIQKLGIDLTEESVSAWLALAAALWFVVAQFCTFKNRRNAGADFLSFLFWKICWPVIAAILVLLVDAKIWVHLNNFFMRFF
ncbi:hypothetical protein FACS1894216_13530 [Synergistales bacterium]|nr:hypothetical protein FACS1894216_13530 [Synergistales bacterium]